MTAPPDPTWPGLLAHWSVEPPVVGLLALVAGVYGRGRRADRTGSPATFGAGLAVVALALLSPLATYAEALLSVHMVQHLLLVLVVAPLLVASRPGPALLAGLPRPLASGLRRARRWRLVQLLRSPLVAWAVFAAVGWVVHFTPLFDLALDHPPIHAAEHLLFLASGVLFWVPVLGPRPMSHPARLLYLAVAMPQNTFLALAIFSAGRPLYEAYGRLARAWGPSLLDDQRQGGGVMWVAGDVALLVAVLAVAAGWARAERLSQE